jgi:diguanylate cyclase (GGDEF)-like protein
MPKCNFHRPAAFPRDAAPVAGRPWPWPLPWQLRLALSALLLALCACPRAAVAAEPDRWAALTHTAFKHQPYADAGAGLCFAQDRAGFVWIGTQTGLVRWDGNRPRKFFAAPLRDDALPDNYITSLLVDGAGRLWVGTSSGGLARYDAERENFTRFAHGPSGLGNAQVTALADDGAGGVWVGTGGGLDHIDARGAVTRGGGAAATTSPPTTAATPLDTRAVPARPVGALLRESRGTLWIGTREGLLRLERGARAPVAVALEGHGAGANISTLMQDSSGRIWIGTRSHGAFVIEPGSAEARAVREGGPAPTLDKERVTAIVEAGLGEVWLGTDGANGGIVAIDPLLGTTRRIRHQPDTPDSLYENDVMALFRERSGIIFVGAMGALSQHDPLPRAVTTIRSTGSAGKLSVPSMLAHPDGRLWLGVVGGGIDIVDPQLGAVAHLTPAPPGTPGALPTGRVLTMTLGRGGTVYLGTEQGLYHANADGGNVRRLAVPQRRPEAAVWALALVGDVLWLGGMDGLWALSVPSAPSADADGRLAVLRHEQHSLGDPRVTYLLPADGGIWVGTRVGLARVADGGGVELVPTALAEADRMPPGYVSALLLDRQGRLWLSQFGTGIAILERTDADGRRRFRRLGTAHGLEDSGANMLLEGAGGAIWASTDANLARVDPRTFAIRTFGPADGVHIPTYWTASGVRTAADELVFGGLSGVTVLRPDRLGQWHYRPPVVATRILVNDQEIPAGRYHHDHGNGNGGGKPAPIAVTPAARGRGFSLEFAALDYSAPERNRYAYRLVGFDPDWIKADATSRRAGYTNLPPGDYVLQLRGSNRNGDWSAPLEVPVRVLPAWHQRPLARVAAGLLAAGLLAALVHARTTLLRRRQRELVAMVDARTTELRATQSQLEQLAYGDPLTGLANRRLFNDELRHLVAQAARGGPGFTLLLIDLDHFKQINDTLGHDAGDALLVAAAARLRAAVRETDRPFRLGGDEFAVLLGQTTERATLEPVCLRILENLAQPLPHGAATMRISASVGAAVHDGGDGRDGQQGQEGRDGNPGTHEELYKRADVALYRAKAAGRNGWHLAGDD